MEKFTFGENKNESLHDELIRRTEVFVKDSNLILSMNFLSIDLLDKLMETISSYKDALEEVTPKNDDECIKIKTALQDLIDMEIVCKQCKILH